MSIRTGTPALLYSPPSGCDLGDEFNHQRRQTQTALAKQWPIFCSRMKSLTEVTWKCGTPIGCPLVTPPGPCSALLRRLGACSTRSWRAATLRTKAMVSPPARQSLSLPRPGRREATCDPACDPAPDQAPTQPPNPGSQRFPDSAGSGDKPRVPGSLRVFPALWLNFMCIHVYLCTTHMPSAHRSQKRMMDPLELEFQIGFEL